MSVTSLTIPGAWVYTPKKFEDERGFFFEWFQDNTFSENSGNSFNLAQANCSISKAGTLRGIHFADVPPGQRKYVTCFSGRAIDVLVDLRVGSPMFGKWEFVELDLESRKVVSIPNGVGHGFIALEDETTIVYLCDQRYNPNSEREINPLDPDLGIDWPTNIEKLLSAKDLAAPNLKDVNFKLPKFDLEI